jgi:hypothetical protein
VTAAVRLQKGLAVMDRNALGYLTDLNRNVEGALAQLEKLAEYPELNNEDFIFYQACFREYVSDANMMVLDALEDFEQETMIKANRERVAYEKKIRDPDDCYLDVMNREKELLKEGLPSQMGFLFGMRRFTKREILSGSFEEGGEAESDTEDGSDSDEEDSVTARGGSDAVHEQ